MFVSVVMEKTMKIGVSGASGRLGQGALRELAARAQGHNVIAISRTPEKAGSGVEARLGDYDQPDTLAQAYAISSSRSKMMLASSCSASRNCARRRYLLRSCYRSTPWGT